MIILKITKNGYNIFILFRITKIKKICKIKKYTFLCNKYHEGNFLKI